MFNHAPKDYICPLCLAAKAIESDATLVKQSDVIFKDNLSIVLINSFFIKNNPGHVIVIPNEHFENLYEIPANVLSHIMELAQKVAIALKDAYECEGVTLLQNNEPMGDQHAFHFHLHVFPRYKNDQLHANMGNKQLADPNIRAEYAQKLKKLLN